MNPTDSSPPENSAETTDEPENHLTEPQEHGDPSESEGTPSEPPAAPTADSTLAEMVHVAVAGRMSPAHETQTADLLRQALLGGKPEIENALDAIGKLPWPVSVNGLNAAWPEMKPYGRRLFVSGIKSGSFEGEIGRRIRLSITRGLVKVDEVQAAKWACAIAAEMLGADGILTTRDRQSFFNVLVGKGKPWMLRLPLEGLKDADIAPLLIAAVGTIFTGGCPPFTQSTLLQWIFKLEKTSILSERAQLAIAQAIRKWPGRLMRDFKNIPENLPEILAQVFQEKAARQTAAENGASDSKKTSERSTTAEAEAEEKDEDTEDNDDDEDDTPEEDDEEEDDDEDENEEAAPTNRREEARGGRPKHPPYISPGQPNRPGNQSARDERGDRNERGGERPGQGNFDPVATLRQLDNFIRQQSQQLVQARTQLRQREEESRRGGGGGGGGGGGNGRRGGRGRYASHGGDNVWPDTTQPEDNESLRRYILQLENTNLELRARLEDLAQDGERRAESLTAADGSPRGEREQLVHFLSLKLARDHADYQKLSREPDDEVFREHYRLLAQNVFEILAAEGIRPQPPEIPAVELG